MTRLADRSFVALVTIALLSSAILVALFVSLLPHLGEPVPALVLALASVGILLGLASLARQLADTFALIRRLLRARVEVPPALAAIAADLGCDGRLDLVGDDRPFAFAYWFARPRVCVSTGLIARLAPDELRAVLAHERWHVARRDPLRIVLARYFAAGLYVIPIIEDLVAHYDLVKEVAADEHAVSALGDVRPLARALYRLMPHAEEMDMGLLAPVGGLSVTEARIEQLVEHRPIVARFPRLHVALSAATLIAALLLLAAHAPLAGRVDILLAWPPAALLALAAASGVSQQVRAVAHR
ncbi:MAG TPA: M56 family metallopeptidase [Candidatus Dormibacteraeota bacterium]|jgi:Zn-dependent protease with chaperone function|nr:M56 family metallopeptidase [Candidatus Dormibacteraeota bacterium]